MTSEGVALFDTGIGACGIAWRSGAIVALQLPEPDGAGATLARMRRHVGDLPEAAPPPNVEAAIHGGQAVMRGEPRDLCELELDMSALPPFQQRVYDFARRIPPGQTRSYGEVAEALGDRRLARAVGHALGRNPFAPIVPCHRVLAANGKPGGFSGGAGPLTKLRMLAIEGARPNGTAPLFDET